ncbi:hypothetical protein IJT10_05110, partial [bacterium]|nr:hypothetical protein [bacterium]
PSIMESQVRDSLAQIEKQIGRQINTIPTTLIVNKSGDIVDVHVGFTEQSEFEEIIDQLSK